jgi:hypothetical protein
VYTLLEVMEMVMDYKVSKPEWMFDINEPLVAQVGGDPLGANPECDSLPPKPAAVSDQEMRGSMLPFTFLNKLPTLSCV